MKNINRVGLITSMLTALIMLGGTYGYYAVDTQLDLSGKYAWLFSPLETSTTPNLNTRAVAGIIDEVKQGIPSIPPQPLPNSYTSLYIAEHGKNVAESELYSPERLNAFLTAHAAPLTPSDIKRVLPVSSQPLVEIIESYAALPRFTGEELLAAVSVPEEHRSAA